MGFADKLKAGLKSVSNKVTDTVVTPKAIFEKNCKKYTAFSTADLFKTVDVKAIVGDKNSVQFSGDILQLTKDLKPEIFFVGEDGAIFTIDAASVSQKIESIAQKEKTAQYTTTVATYEYKTISLVKAKK